MNSTKLLVEQQVKSLVAKQWRRRYRQIHSKVFCADHAYRRHNAHAKFISIRAALYSVPTLSCK